MCGNFLQMKYPLLRLRMAGGIVEELDEEQLGKLQVCTFLRDLRYMYYSLYKFNYKYNLSQINGKDYLKLAQGQGCGSALILCGSGSSLDPGQ